MLRLPLMCSRLDAIIDPKHADFWYCVVSSVLMSIYFTLDVCKTQHLVAHETALGS